MTHNVNDPNDPLHAICQKHLKELYEALIVHNCIPVILILNPENGSANIAAPQSVNFQALQTLLMHLASTQLPEKQN